MFPSGDAGKPRRKRRTRQHVIEGLSRNHLERNVLLKGHVLCRPDDDYGVDAIMFHYADDGTIENGEVRFQLKATDRLKRIKRGTIISFPIATGDLDYWAAEIYPFYLVVFDAKTEKAFWLDIQEHVSRHPQILDTRKQEVSVQIPASNKLTVKSVETFRKKSLQVVDQFKTQCESSDVERKKPK